MKTAGVPEGRRKMREDESHKFQTIAVASAEPWFSPSHNRAIASIVKS